MAAIARKIDVEIRILHRVNRAFLLMAIILLGVALSTVIQAQPVHTQAQSSTLVHNAKF